jgi:hypothetical protein
LDRARKLTSLRGLSIGLALSLVNLAGAFLMLSALGGLDPWTPLQFLGLFGVFEAGTGIAYLFGPNIWRLPVAEANTRDSVRLAPSVALLPHWPAAAKVLGGGLFLVAAVVGEGVGLAALGLPVLLVAIGAGSYGISLLAARAGVARPDLDVVYFSIRRPGGEPREFPGISLLSLLVQLVLNTGVLFVAKALDPSALYREGAGPSLALLGCTIAIGGAFAAAGALAWWGRSARRAPAEQQREAEAAHSGESLSAG